MMKSCSLHIWLGIYMYIKKTFRFSNCLPLVCRPSISSSTTACIFSRGNSFPAFSWLYLRNFMVRCFSRLLVHFDTSFDPLLTRIEFDNPLPLQTPPKSHFLTNLGGFLGATCIHPIILMIKCFLYFEEKNFLQRGRTSGGWHTGWGGLAFFLSSMPCPLTDLGHCPNSQIHFPQHQTLLPERISRNPCSHHFDYCLGVLALLGGCSDSCPVQLWSHMSIER